jgi:DNA-binding LacI/PurR family transcriptional regulator
VNDLLFQFPLSSEEQDGSGARDPARSLYIDRREARMRGIPAMPGIPKSKCGQLADLLRDRIVTGAFGKKLPSERRLADEYLVSRTTLRQALAILTKEKLIDGSVSTRSGRSVKQKVRQEPAQRLRQVMVLTPTLRGSPLLHEQLASLREMLSRAELPVHVQEASALIERAYPASGLRRIASRQPNTIWILHKMPEPVQIWFTKSGLPAVIFGSAFPGIALPSVDIDFHAVARHATGLCLARGHRRITLLTHRTNLAGDNRSLNAVTEQLALAGAPRPRVMHHDFNRLRLMDALDSEIVSRIGRCDALIVASHHHLLTALPHLLRRGIAIPADLSLIYLSNDLSVERLSPLPVRYDSGTTLVRRLVQAVKAIAGGEMPVSSLIIPKMLEGETLAPPR